MKTLLGFILSVLVLGLTGCVSEGGYGGAYAGVSGEYPTTYYGREYYPGYVYPAPYVVRPYDRDHYWDRRRYWERRRWHGDEGWEHRDRD